MNIGSLLIHFLLASQNSSSGSGKFNLLLISLWICRDVGGGGAVGMRSTSSKDFFGYGL